jgi:hypothetical protein
MLRFEAFRLFLRRNIQKDIEDTDQDRREWIESALRESFDFDHYSKNFHFKPLPEDERPSYLGEHIIAGWLARQTVVDERTPPEDGLQPTKDISWRAALIFIDPTEHSDGQKIGMEKRSDIGQSLPILRTLFKHLEDRNRGYGSEIFPIQEEGSFLRFVANHQGRINWLQYEAVVPNMFESSDAYSEELRELRDKAGVQKVRTTLSSPSPIEVEQTPLADIGGDIEAGGGAVKARTVDGESYNSQRDSKSYAADTEDEKSETPRWWELIKPAVRGLFGE